MYLKCIDKMNTPAIPTPDTIPVNYIWLYILLVLTFILHLVLVNLVLGGSLLALWDQFKRKPGSELTKNLPIMVALAINLGIPPLLFLQVLYGNFFYTSSVLMAFFWILVIPVLILSYYATYVFVKQKDKLPFWSKLALMFSVLFLFFITFMFVDNTILSQTPGNWTNYFVHKSGTYLLWADSTLWPRILHFVLASIAIAALGKALFIKYSKKAKSEIKAEAIKKSLKIVAWATLVQFAAGIWFLLSLPGPVMKLFLGAELMPTFLMALVLLIAFAILYFSFTAKLNLTLIFSLVEVMVMCIVRELLRIYYLSDIFHPSSLQNQQQNSPFIVFLLVFITGILIIFYMINRAQKPKNPTS